MLKQGSGSILAGIVALCVLVVVGCGSSSEEELTKAELIKQGNAICEAAQKDREKIVQEGLESLDEDGDVKAQQAELVVKALPSYEQAAEELGDLAAPSGMTGRVEALVAAMEDAAEQVRANPQTATVSLLQFKDADEKAKAVKLDSCVA